MSTNLKALIDKLNDTTRKALEAAAGLSMSAFRFVLIALFLLSLESP